MKHSLKHLSHDFPYFLNLDLEQKQNKNRLSYLYLLLRQRIEIQCLYFIMMMCTWTQYDVRTFVFHFSVFPYAGHCNHFVHIAMRQFLTQCRHYRSKFLHSYVTSLLIIKDL